MHTSRSRRQGSTSKESHACDGTRRIKKGKRSSTSHTPPLNVASTSCTYKPVGKNFNVCRGRGWHCRRSSIWKWCKHHADEPIFNFGSKLLPLTFRYQEFGSNDGILCSKPQHELLLNECVSFFSPCQKHYKKLLNKSPSLSVYVSWSFRDPCDVSQVQRPAPRPQNQQSRWRHGRARGEWPDSQCHRSHMRFGTFIHLHPNWVMVSLGVWPILVGQLSPADGNGDRREGLYTWAYYTFALGWLRYCYEKIHVCKWMRSYSSYMHSTSSNHLLV